MGSIHRCIQTRFHTGDSVYVGVEVKLIWVLVGYVNTHHTELNSTFFMVQKHELDNCKHCGLWETVEHVLFQCQMSQA